MAAKPTVSELLERIDALEARIVTLETSASRPSTRTEKQRSVQRYIDDSELAARRAAMAKAKAEAMSGHVTAKVTW